MPVVVAAAETIAAMLLATRTHVRVRLQEIPEKGYTLFLEFLSEFA